MTLPTPPGRYDSYSEAQRNKVIEDSDRLNLKRNADVEFVAAKLILRSPNGARWKVTVDNAGVLAAVAL